MSATAVKERPILFSGEMVKAIMDGRKTQTRRIVKPQPYDGAMLLGPEVYTSSIVDRHGDLAPGKEVFGIYDADGEWGLACPYGRPGDRLWVRETWAGDDACGVIYRADHPDADIKRGDLDDGDQCLRAWRPSIHCPRWASRITLEIVSVRVERLHEISEADAIAEGCPECPQCVGSPWGRGALDDELSNAAGGRPWSACFGRCDGLTAKQWFKALWQSINGPGSWDVNPWVWVIEFKRLEPCAP